MDPTQRDDADAPLDEATHQAEAADAMHGHGADREPTEDEEIAAERGSSMSPDVSEPYEEALHRGADVKGEGQILPD
jgi:hypothetical protein